MKHTTNELIDIVRLYYTRGVSNDDPRYKETEEYLRLAAARRRAGADCKAWRSMLQKLGRQFPENAIMDHSAHLPTGHYDACYYGTIELPNGVGEHSHSLGFLVSFLVPYYCVYSLRIVEDVEKTEAVRASQERAACVFVHDTMYVLPANIVKPEILAQQRPLQVLRHDISFELSPDEQPYGASIVQEIEATWGYARMPPEVGNVIVPDVATNLRSIGEATLYDCLFSDSR
jgi:hypothetical protein